MNALAVMPCTCSPTRVVITVTPVANIPSVRRNSTAGSASEPAAASICSGGGATSKNDSPIPSGAPAIESPCMDRSNSLGGSIDPILTLRPGER